MVRLGAITSPLSTDPSLASLLPGGLYSREAGGASYPFLVLSLTRMDTDYTFTRAWRYKFNYLLTVTDEGESIDAASAALQRVNELLQDAGSSMPMEDFILGYIRRTGRVQPPQPLSSGVAYQRIGDEYAIEVYP